MAEEKHVPFTPQEAAEFLDADGNGTISYRDPALRGNPRVVETWADFKLAGVQLAWDWS